MYVATIQWGKRGKRHLYDWEAVRTVCGKDAPYWPDVDGPVTYWVVNTHRLASCANCLTAATAEVIEQCRTDR